MTMNEQETQQAKTTEMAAEVVASEPEAPQPGRLRKGAMAARTWVRRLSSRGKDAAVKASSTTDMESDDSSRSVASKDNNLVERVSRILEANPSLEGEDRVEKVLEALRAEVEEAAKETTESENEDELRRKIELALEKIDAHAAHVARVDRVMETLRQQIPEYEKTSDDELRRKVELALQANDAEDKAAASGGEGGEAKESSRIRKAGVAVGGGALMTVGAVLMVTPLHPVGHAMAIGGGLALGTEFEAPRRVAQSARKRLSKLRGKQEDPAEDDTEKTKEASSTAGSKAQRTDIRELYEIGTKVDMLEKMYPPDVVKEVVDEIEQERRLVDQTNPAEPEQTEDENVPGEPVPNQTNPAEPEQSEEETVPEIPKEAELQQSLSVDAAKPIVEV